MKSISLNIKSTALIMALVGLPIASSAQNNENLVDNGGFESTTGKIKKPGQIDLATGWKSPTGARADVFLKESKVPEIGVPNNVYGKEDAKEGENYAGIMAFSYGNKAPRTYLSAKLKTPLKKDVKYCVSFNLSLAEASKYSCNEVGINIGKREFGTDQKTAIIDKANILHPNNKIFNAAYNWEKICGVFTADGGEKFITIGNFSSNEATKYETNKKLKDSKVVQVIGAYYYIDDIEVKILGEDETCDCNSDDVDPNKFSTTIYQKQVVNGDKMLTKEKIQSQGLYFAFGKEKLSQQAIASLDIIATEMKNNPTLSITLIGHTDIGEDELAAKKVYYADMDKKRVETIKAYLGTKGINSSRIKSELKGSTEDNTVEFKDNDDDDLKMAKNRRVEVRVN